MLERSRVTQAEAPTQCLQSQHAKKVKCLLQKTTMSDDFWSWRRKWDGVLQRRRTNRVWPFQQDYVMCDDTHHRARASPAFVVKKCINIIFFRKWLIVSLDKALISRLGSCRFLWSCIEAVFFTLKSLATIEVHYMEKNPGMFSLKKKLKKERHEHLGWHGGE